MSPKEKSIKDYSVSQEVVGNIRSFLQIILCETSLIKRQQDLTEPGVESVRVIDREVQMIAKLLPDNLK